MKISVVIPTFNEEKCIAQTVEHLARTGSKMLFEIIVVDAKSDDRTVLFAEKAGANVLFSNQKCRAAQMNLGAKRASGDWLYFVHADVLPPQTWAFDIVEAVEKGHEMGCFRSRFDSKSWLLKINAWFTRLPFLWCQGGDKTFFISKNNFFELGGYDEKMAAMEEYAFLKKARVAGFRLFIVPKNALVSARKYEGRNWLRVNLANFIVFTFFRFGADSTFLKKVYSKMLD